MNFLNNYSEFYSKSISIFTLENYRPKKKCIFLDRDGVIIEDTNYINLPEKVKLTKNLILFLEIAKLNNFDIVIVTNQSSISRGIISYKDYKKITNRILSYIPIKLHPNLILTSFHLPNNQSNLENFNWRKPGEGMFNYALTTNNYDVSRSIMIGDKISDLIPASSCGLSKLIYIPSDLHQNQLNNITAWNSEGNQPIKIIKDLDPKEVFNYL